MQELAVAEVVYLTDTDEAATGNRVGWEEK